jgi:hypothetical protein
LPGEPFMSLGVAGVSDLLPLFFGLTPSIISAYATPIENPHGTKSGVPGSSAGPPPVPGSPHVFTTISATWYLCRYVSVVRGGRVILFDGHNGGCGLRGERVFSSRCPRRSSGVQGSIRRARTAFPSPHAHGRVACDNSNPSVQR